jgi:polyhydroxybutyrate depolymerase
MTAANSAPSNVSRHRTVLGARICALLTLAALTASSIIQPTGAVAATSSVKKRSLVVKNSKRTYRIAIHSTKAKRRPLVLVFHGHGGSADQVLGLNANGASPLGRWIDIGQTNDLVIAALEGEIGSDGKQGWNDCRRDAPNNPQTEDVAATLALIDELTRTERIDPTKVYAIGMSNGGHFVLRLALEAGNRFAGFGSVAAALAANSACTDKGAPKPFVLINGTADRIVPFNGGNFQNRGVVLSFSDTLATLVARSGPTTTPSQAMPYPDVDSTDGSTAALQTFGSVTAPVHAVTVTGGGHAEPSRIRQYSAAYERIIGRQNHDFESADEQWRLLSAATGVRRR